MATHTKDLSLDHVEPRLTQAQFQFGIVVQVLMAPRSHCDIKHASACVNPRVFWPPHPFLLSPVTAVALRQRRQIRSREPQNTVFPQNSSAFPEQRNAFL